MTTSLDALAAGHRGRYDDGRVAVCRQRDQGVLAHLLADREPALRTQHFVLHLPPGRVVVLHDLAPDDIDNDLTGLLAGELFATGLLSDAADFERIFTGVVLSSVHDPVLAWALFYGNTLAGLRSGGTGHGSIAELAPVYDRVDELVRGEHVLEVGSCFGFGALLLAERGRQVVATDLSAGTMRLLSVMAHRRRVPLLAAAADAHALPFAADSTDTALAVHLLEHLPVDAAPVVLAELVRVARCRVVVAVPYEDVPTAAYGHVRTFCRDDLDRLGAGTGLPFRTEDRCGGWLVVDTA